MITHSCLVADNIRVTYILAHPVFSFSCFIFTFKVILRRKNKHLNLICIYLTCSFSHELLSSRSPNNRHCYDPPNILFIIVFVFSSLADNFDSSIFEISQLVDKKQPKHQFFFPFRAVDSFLFLSNFCDRRRLCLILLMRINFIGEPIQNPKRCILSSLVLRSLRDL